MRSVYDEWGVADGYHEVNGTWHDTPAATRDLVRAAMGEPVATDPLWFVDEGATQWLNGRCRLITEDGTDRGDIDALPGDLPIGYHRLAPLDGGPVTALIVSPTTCIRAPYGWGVAAQVYSLWRPDGWGIGDLRDVAELGRQISDRGGISLLLSPLHAGSHHSAGDEPLLPQLPPLAEPDAGAPRRSLAGRQRRRRPHRPQQHVAGPPACTRRTLHPRSTGPSGARGPSNKGPICSSSALGTPSPSASAPAGRSGPATSGTPTVRH